MVSLVSFLQAHICIQLTELLKGPLTSSICTWRYFCCSKVTLGIEYSHNSYSLILDPTVQNVSAFWWGFSPNMIYLLSVYVTSLHLLSGIINKTKSLVQSSGGAPDQAPVFIPPQYQLVWDAYTQSSLPPKLQLNVSLFLHNIGTSSKTSCNFQLHLFIAGRGAKELPTHAHCSSTS